MEECCEIYNINLKAFTIGFMDNKLDELPYAKNIAQHLKIEHNSTCFNHQYLKNLLMNFANVYDEPIADKAALPTMLVAQMAKSKVEYIFSGEGADEIFASSGFLHNYNLIRKIPYSIRLISSKILKLAPKTIKYEKWSKILEQKDIADALKYHNMTMEYSQVKSIIKAPVKELLLSFDNSDSDMKEIDRFFPRTLKSYVSDNLITKLHFGTNAYQIESKVPYLNKNFLEFMASVDLTLKRKNKINQNLNPKCNF